MLEVADQLVEVEGGPHVLCVTHADEVNQALLAFLKQPALAGARWRRRSG